MKIDLKKSVPLYQQIVQDLRKKISSQQIMIGDCLGSQQEIADQYQVSLITARKAMAILIEEGILVGQVGRGMYVAGMGKEKSPADHKTIGLVLSDMQEPFFSRVVCSIEAKASEYGYTMMIANSAEIVEREERQIERFLHMRVPGLIIAAIGHQHHGMEAVYELKKTGFPFVMISYLEDQDLYYVGTDHERGAFMATEHLIHIGYKEIGYISAAADDVLGAVRCRGYRRALEQYGLFFDQQFVYYLESNTYSSGYEIGRRFMKTKKKPRALFIFDDISALGFERALLDHGWQIPEQVAIVGFDNIEASAGSLVPLTTIHQPTHEIGCLAFDTLLKRIQGSPAPLRSILEPRLIVRQSCGAGYKRILAT